MRLFCSCGRKPRAKFHPRLSSQANDLVICTNVKITTVKGVILSFRFLVKEQFMHLCARYMVRRWLFYGIVRVDPIILLELLE